MILAVFCQQLKPCRHFHKLSGGVCELDSNSVHFQDRVSIPSSLWPPKEGSWIKGKNTISKIPFSQHLAETKTRSRVAATFRTRLVLVSTKFFLSTQQHHPPPLHLDTSFISSTKRGFFLVLWMSTRIIFVGLNRRQECYVINYSQRNISWDSFL